MINSVCWMFPKTNVDARRLQILLTQPYGMKSKSWILIFHSDKQFISFNMIFLVGQLVKLVKCSSSILVEILVDRVANEWIIREFFFLVEYVLLEHRKYLDTCSIFLSPFSFWSCCYSLIHGFLFFLDTFGRTTSFQWSIIANQFPPREWWNCLVF